MIEPKTLNCKSHYLTQKKYYVINLKNVRIYNIIPLFLGKITLNNMNFHWFPNNNTNFQLNMNNTNFDICFPLAYPTGSLPGETVNSPFLYQFNGCIDNFFQQPHLPHLFTLLFQFHLLTLWMVDTPWRHPIKDFTASASIINLSTSSFGYSFCHSSHKEIRR